MVLNGGSLYQPDLGGMLVIGLHGSLVEGVSSGVHLSDDTSDGQRKGRVFVCFFLPSPFLPLMLLSPPKTLT